ncbi:hypothetical protein J6590_066759 [Homalodisca vitripennis]|nr:hypothetical protein J6590_066759 [Homalodisca vitripennis]
MKIDTPNFIERKLNFIRWKRVVTIYRWRPEVTECSGPKSFNVTFLSHPSEATFQRLLSKSWGRIEGTLYLSYVVLEKVGASSVTASPVKALPQAQATNSH